MAEKQSRAGRPLKPADQVKGVQVGLKVTAQEWAFLGELVVSENGRLVGQGYEPLATPAGVLRRLIREEAVRRGFSVGPGSFRGPSIPLGPDLEPLSGAALERAEAEFASARATSVEGVPRNGSVSGGSGEDDPLAGWVPPV